MKKVFQILLNEFTNDSRVLKTSSSLAKNGYEVTVLAIHKRGLPRKELKFGIDIERIDLKSLKLPKGWFFLIFKYLEYIIKAVRKCDSHSIVHCNDYAALPVGLIARLIYKDVKIIYDAHELESERFGQSRLHNMAVEYFEKISFPFVANVITVSDSIADFYSEKFSINLPTVVLNVPEYRGLIESNYFRLRFNIPDDYTIFLYQGGLADKRGIIEFVNLMVPLEKCAYVVMGYGYLKGKILKLSESVPNLYFHDAVPPENLYKYTASADFGVCIESNCCLSWDFALPNKLFEYLHAGLPVIVANLTEISKFVTRYDVGIVIDQAEPINFKKDVMELISRRLEVHSKIKDVVQIYNWGVEEKKLLALYEGLINE